MTYRQLQSSQFPDQKASDVHQAGSKGDIWRNRCISINEVTAGECTTSLPYRRENVWETRVYYTTKGVEVSGLRSPLRLTGPWYQHPHINTHLDFLKSANL